MTLCIKCDHASELWATSVDIEYNSIPNLFEYHYCGNCKLGFLKNPPIDKLSIIYPHDYYSFENTQENLIYKIKSLFERQLIYKSTKQFKKLDPIKILDLGGGSGYFAKTCFSLFPNSIVTVTDFEIRNEHENKSHNLKFVSCDLNQSFPDGKYDVIIAWNILEHIIDPFNFISKCYAALNSNGVLLIQTPNINTFSARIFRRSYWGGLHSPRHFVLFEARSLTKNLQLGGFNKIKLKNVQAAHFWAVSVCNYFGINAKKAGKPVVKLKSYKLFLYVFAIIDIIVSKFTKTGQIQVTAYK